MIVVGVPISNMETISVEPLLDDLAGVFHPNIEMKLLEQTVNKAMNGGSRPRHNAGVNFSFLKLWLINIPL